jgi:hypothetical protein
VIPMETFHLKHAVNQRSVLFALSSVTTQEKDTYEEFHLRRGADKSLAFPICSTTTSSWMG